MTNQAQTRQPPEGYRLDQWGNFWCNPGLPTRPVFCERHSEHYFCRTCQGYYGVPHDDIHKGPDAHPRWDTKGCACRPCIDYHGDPG